MSQYVRDLLLAISLALSAIAILFWWSEGPRGGCGHAENGEGPETIFPTGGVASEESRPGAEGREEPERPLPTLRARGAAPALVPQLVQDIQSLRQEIAALRGGRIRRNESAARGLLVWVQRLQSRAPDAPDSKFTSLRSLRALFEGQKETDPQVGRALPGPPFEVLPNGVLVSGGYCFRMAVCAGLEHTMEFRRPGASTLPVLDVDQSSKGLPTYVVYAWPLEYGFSGHRTFVVYPDGRLLVNEKSTYSGWQGQPGAGDALPTADHCEWRPVR